MAVPQPSLAQTLLKITSIDVDGRFAEPEPVHCAIPSIDCFDLAHLPNSNLNQHLPKSKCHTESLIFPEKNHSLQKSSAFAKRKPDFDEAIFRFRLTQAQQPSQTLNILKSVSIGSGADDQSSPFGVADFISTLIRVPEKKIAGGRFSSFIKFESAIDLSVVGKSEQIPLEP
jgi:hypothetical protein